MAGGARRPDDRPHHRTRPRDAPHPPAGRRGRRPHPGADGGVPGWPHRAGAGVRARVRLRARAGDVDAGRLRPLRRRRGGGADHPLADRSPPGCRRQPRAGPSRARPRRSRLLLAVLGRRPRRPCRRRRRRGPGDRHGDLLAGVAGPGPDPRPPLPRSDPALGAGHQGPHLHADGRHGRRAHHVTARDAAWRAELGLPLHLDAGLHLHPPGPALDEPRLGSRRVHGVRGRPRRQPGRGAPDHVRDRRPARPDRVDPRPPDRLRRRPPGQSRQRRVQPAPERRVRRRPRRHPPPLAAEQAPAAPAVADRRGPGPLRHRRVGRPGPGHLGGPRKAAALRVVEAHVLGRARPGREAGRAPRDGRPAGHLAEDGRRDPQPTSSTTG